MTHFKKSQLKKIKKIAYTDSLKGSSDIKDITLFVGGFVRGYCLAKGIKEEFRVLKIADEILNFILWDIKKKAIRKNLTKK